VDTNTGEVAWRIPLGAYAELEAKGIKNAGALGALNLGGSIATAGGLIFIAATNDERFRAFDSRSGRELWRVQLDASGNATPITYRGSNGTQYVAIVEGGPGHLRRGSSGDSVVAFRLAGNGVNPARRDPTAAASTRRNGALTLPEGEGKAEVERVCSACHGLGTAIDQNRTEEEWRAVVDSMAGRGAQGTESDFQAIVKYLAKNFARH
jgi:quinoprotein glucose dehydrogenase